MASHSDRARPRPNNKARLSAVVSLPHNNNSNNLEDRHRQVSHNPDSNSRHHKLSQASSVLAASRAPEASRNPARDPRLPVRVHRWELAHPRAPDHR